MEDEMEDENILHLGHSADEAIAEEDSVEDKEGNDQQIPSDSIEKSKSDAERKKRRSSYLERAHIKQFKKNVRIKEPIESPHHDNEMDKSEENKTEDHVLDISDEARGHVANIVAGCLSSITSTGVSQPLSEIKRRFQLQDNRKMNRGIWQDARVIYAEKGLKGFWKGHTKEQITGVFHGMILFWTYNQVMTALDKIPMIDEYDLLKNFTAGFCSGAATTFVAFPIDQLRLRIAALIRIKRRFSAVDLRPLLKIDVRHLFYRGIWPKFLHNSLNYGYKFLFYNMFCEQVFAKTTNQERDEIPSKSLLMAGAAAGLIAHQLTYPLELITRRLQTHSLKRQGFAFDHNCRTLLQCFILVVRMDGFSGLYKGVLPVVMRTTVNTGIMFAVFDKMHKIMEKEI